MLKRFTVCSTNRQIRSAGDCPVLITAYSVLHDNFTNNYLLQLKFSNFHPEPVIGFGITAVYNTESVDGDRYESYFYENIDVGRDAQFGQDTAIILGEEEPLNIRFIADSISFSGCEAISCSQEFSCVLPAFRRLEDIFEAEEIGKQYKIRYGNDCVYGYEEHDNFWLCTCGALNLPAEALCHKCRRPLAALKSINISSVKADAVKRIREENSTIQEEKEASDKKNKRIIRLVSILLPVVLIAGILLATVPKAVKRENTYKQAVQQLELGNYDKARELFEAVPGYKDSSTAVDYTIPFLRACSIIDSADAGDLSALSLINEKQTNFATDNEALSAMYSGASDILSTLEATDECIGRIQYCEDKIEGLRTDKLDTQYDESCALLESGQFREAYNSFLSISGYKDSETMSVEALYRQAQQALELIKEVRLENVYAYFSRDVNNASVIAMTDETARALGSDTLERIKLALASDGVVLDIVNTPEKDYLPVCEAVADCFNKLSPYRDSDKLALEAVNAADYTKELKDLIAAGQLQDALNWIEAFDGAIDGKDALLERINTYLPFCGSWTISSGDATLIPLTADINSACYDISVRVSFDDSGEIMIISPADGSFEVELTAEPGELKFINYHEGAFYNYIAAFTVQGRFAYMKYSAVGQLSSSCEYSR